MGLVKQHKNSNLHKKNSPVAGQLLLTSNAQIVEGRPETLPMTASKQALHAEVRNALHIAQYNISFASAEADGDRFRFMFPGHVAAQNYHCGRTKVSYLCFGIA